MDLSLYTNPEYNPGPAWKRLIWYFVNVLFFINPLNLSSNIKIQLLKLFGAKIGDEVTIKQNVNIKHPWFLEIGNHVWIGEGVWIDNLTKVTIGSNVCISQGALLLCGNHNYKRKEFDLMLGEITVKDSVWIGAKSVVCGDVVMYPYAILAVGSVLSSDAEESMIYRGNPAVQIRKRVLEG